VFFVDDAYQLFVTKGNKLNKHNFKSVPCHGVPSGSITGVFRAEEEFCAPCFGELEKGRKYVFSPKVISVPVIDDEDKLLFTVQIECDPEAIAPRRKPSKLQRQGNKGIKEQE